MVALLWALIICALCFLAGVLFATGHRWWMRLSVVVLIAQLLVAVFLLLPLFSGDRRGSINEDYVFAVAACWLLGLLFWVWKSAKRPVVST